MKSQLILAFVILLGGCGNEVTGVKEAAGEPEMASARPDERADLTESQIAGFDESISSGPSSEELRSYDDYRAFYENQPNEVKQKFSLCSNISWRMIDGRAEPLPPKLISVQGSRILMTAVERETGAMTGRSQCEVTETTASYTRINPAGQAFGRSYSYSVRLLDDDYAVIEYPQGEERVDLLDGRTRALRVNEQRSDRRAARDAQLAENLARNIERENRARGIVANDGTAGGAEE